MICYLGDIICTEAYQEIEENGMTPLHLACWHQNRNVVKYVLRKYKNATTVHGRNNNLPFHLACNWYEHLRTGVMHILLNMFRGALLCKTNNDNSLPLHYFMQSKPTSTNDLFFLT